MKKLLLILILLIPLVQASPEISVKTAYTNPYPVEPGTNFILDIEVSNLGDEAAKDLTITLKPNQPFTVVDKNQEVISNFGSGTSRIVEFKLFVDISAVSSVYQIPVEIKYSGSNEITRNVNLRIQGKPNIAYVNIPSFSILPGETKTLKVEINNLGSGSAKRVIASLESSSENIKPVLSGGNVYVGDISPQNKKDAIFQIYVNPDTNYGVYDTTIKITYEDESGNLNTKSFKVGLLVSGNPDIKIIKTSVNEAKKELEVDVINDGNSEARGIKGELLLNGAIIDVDYISKINAKKSSTLKFDIPQTKDNKIDLKISYLGPDNQEYSFTEKIAWSIPSQTNWLVIIAIIVLAYFVIRKIKESGVFKKKKS
ncbi:MAG: hypothetical protein QXM68_02325 [Candidatus Aenigmatarchaeota archaeon]|nr:hypothetical protein [Candidatus Aenigmarchaeota archaeon]